MDTITTVEPPLIHNGLHLKPLTAEVSPSNPSITPLDHIEGTNVRSKLRLYAILSALYVTQPIQGLS
jgi:hypothetical protein